MPLHLNTRELDGQRAAFRIQEANTARYIISGDASCLENKSLAEIPHPKPERLISILEDAGLRELLPASIRAPIPLDPAEGSGFHRDEVPPGLSPMPGRIVEGSRADDAPALFVSRPVTGKLAMLQFDVAGGGRGTSLELVPSGGGPPVKVPMGKPGKTWRKVAVCAPPDGFTVRASREAGAGWLAFTWPRDFARGSYLVRRLLATGIAVEAIGFLMLLAGLRRMREF